MVDNQNTYDQLTEFAENVVRSARYELQAKQPKKVYRAKWKNGQLKSYQVRTKRYKPDASGKLAKSLSFEVKEVLGNLVVVFSAEEYWYYVNFGRDKGSYAPVKVIEDWIRDKPIKPQDFGTDKDGKLYTKGFKKNSAKVLKSMSFMINRKIKTFGIEGNKFWTKSFDIHSEELQESLGKKVAKDLANSIQKSITA